jgi:hypothetical protein
MGRTALDIRHKADSTGIMLVFRSVKSLGGSLVSPLFMFAHDDSLRYKNHIETNCPAPHGFRREAPSSYFYMEIRFYASGEKKKQAEAGPSLDNPMKDGGQY